MRNSFRKMTLEPPTRHMKKKVEIEKRDTPPKQSHRHVRSTMTNISSPSSPLVSFRASRQGPKCPFGNKEVSFELTAGSCVCLAGNSGAGKTTLAMCLAGLSAPASLRKNLNIAVECRWNDNVPPQERCGVLFQQTTLLDELTVAGNLHVALQQTESQSQSVSSSTTTTIKSCMEAVGLNYARDASKRPSQLSGGMARRASLALQLAQRKRVVVLDEPFTGLDPSAAAGVAKELVRLRRTHRCALLLISHEPDLVALVTGKSTTNGHGDVDQGAVTTVTLEPPRNEPDTDGSIGHDDDDDKYLRQPSLFGTTLGQRFAEKLIDYVLWSMPLILLTFTACGLAIAMLSADILRRIDVTDRVLDIVDKEVKPLLKMVLGDDASSSNPFAMMAVRMKVKSMLNQTVPGAKASLYALGMAKLFVLEVGPLLTALLLCGRIGGSYAGKVATMQATAQTKLLQTLGVNPRVWSLAPSLLAAVLASPILTVVGTTMAVLLGGLVGPQYGIGTQTSYRTGVEDAVLLPMRLRCWPSNEPSATWDIRPTFSDSYTDALVEVTTHPIVFHLIKATVFMIITILVAEICASLRPNLTPRGVPSVITSSIVIGSLSIIVADWGFSQLWLLRH